MIKQTAVAVALAAIVLTGCGSASNSNAGSAPTSNVSSSTSQVPTTTTLVHFVEGPICDQLPLPHGWTSSVKEKVAPSDLLIEMVALNAAPPAAVDSCKVEMSKHALFTRLFVFRFGSEAEAQNQLAVLVNNAKTFAQQSTVDRVKDLPKGQAKRLYGADVDGYLIAGDTLIAFSTDQVAYETISTFYVDFFGGDPVPSETTSTTSPPAAPSPGGVLVCQMAPTIDGYTEFNRELIPSQPRDDMSSEMKLLAVDSMDSCYIATSKGRSPAIVEVFRYASVATAQAKLAAIVDYERQLYSDAPATISDLGGGEVEIAPTYNDIPSRYVITGSTVLSVAAPAGDIDTIVKSFKQALS